MDKLLIGITGTARSGVRANARHLADQLQLRQWQMQQPILEAASALTGIALQQILQASPEAEIPALKLRLGQLLDRLHITTRTANHDYLVANLSERMYQQRGSQLYSGNLVMGITTTHEANWLRARGGLLVHLVGKDSGRTGAVTPTDADLLLYSSAEPSHQELATTLAQVRHALHRHGRKVA